MHALTYIIIKYNSNSRGRQGIIWNAAFCMSRNPALKITQKTGFCIRCTKLLFQRLFTYVLQHGNSFILPALLSSLSIGMHKQFT